jgi:hypothetical protein
MTGMMMANGKRVENTNEVLLSDIWEPKKVTSRAHELLRQELHAAVDSLDSFYSGTAHGMLMLLNNMPAPCLGGSSMTTDPRTGKTICIHHGSIEVVEP